MTLNEAKYKGAYIDINYLLAILMDFHRKAASHDEAFAYGKVFSWLAKVKAADVQLVRHGRWEDIEPAPHGMHYVTCSVCGERQTVEKMNFCPNCGCANEVKE